MKIFFTFIFTLFISNSSQAAWSWGLGYHNPPNATAGLNFMYLWTNWAFETGIGYIGSTESANSKYRDSQGNTSSSDTDRVQYVVGGDLNLKYLFGSGFFRPYLQGGFLASVSTSNSGQVSAGAALSSPFGGAGIFLFGGPFYVYLSAVFINASTLQIGIGF